jgi:hypothetical protein
MAREHRNLGDMLSEPLPPDVQAADDRRMAELIASLPEASGTFTGTFGPDVDVTALLGPVPDLMPVEIDTGDEPNPAATFMTELKVTTGEQTWTLPVDHVDLLGGNRVRIWVRRPAASPLI